MQTRKHVAFYNYLIGFRIAIECESWKMDGFVYYLIGFQIIDGENQETCSAYNYLVGFRLSIDGKNCDECGVF